MSHHCLKKFLNTTFKSTAELLTEINFNLKNNTSGAFSRIQSNIPNPKKKAAKTFHVSIFFKLFSKHTPLTENVITHGPLVGYPSHSSTLVNDAIINRSPQKDVSISDLFCRRNWIDRGNGDTNLLTRNLS